MAKINFTKEHFSKMCNLAMDMLLDNGVINTKMGQFLNIVELIHTTSINTLKNIRFSLEKQIEKLESQDEWIADNTSQYGLEKAKEQKELVNLIIGYKRYQLEAQQISAKKAELVAKIAQMKEETKTPEDRLKEAEEELAALEAPTF